MKPLIICTTLLVEKSPQALPLGAACIASAIKQSALTRDLCEVKLTAFSMEDDAVREKSEQETAEYIARGILQLSNSENAGQVPAIVCFSVFVWNRLILEKAAEELRAKGIITIAGGPEITAHPEVFTAFDYTVSGEGEIKVPQLVEELLRKPKDKPAPAQDGNHHSKRAEDSCPLTAANIDLATLSSPYLDGTIDPAEYGGALWELARGCPFKCSYCYESKGSKTVRLFPMERIRAELDLFAAKKIPQVFVLDPTYNANKDRALQKY